MTLEHVGLREKDSQGAPPQAFAWLCLSPIGMLSNDDVHGKIYKKIHTLCIATETVHSILFIYWYGYRSIPEYGYSRHSTTLLKIKDFPDIILTSSISVSLCMIRNILIMMNMCWYAFLCSVWQLASPFSYLESCKHSVHVEQDTRK